MFFRKMSVYLLIISVILGAGSFAIAAMDSVKDGKEYNETGVDGSTHEISASLSDEINEDTNVNVSAILSANAYDRDTIITLGKERISSIAASNETFHYWQEADIVDFQWLHSFTSGAVTHALFELRTADGKTGHMVYDCVRNVPSSYCASASPYALLKDTLSGTASSPDSREVYYFYLGASYGFGEIKDNGLIDIYNIMSILEPVSEEETVLRDVSFSEAATANANKERVRTVVGSEEAIRDYEARRGDDYGG